MSTSEPIRYDLEVPADGHIHVQVPLSAGSHVTIYVVESTDMSDDLLPASNSSTAFWDNPADDEDWNNA